MNVQASDLPTGRLFIGRWASTGGPLRLWRVWWDWPNQEDRVLICLSGGGDQLGLASYNHLSTRRGVVMYDFEPVEIDITSLQNGVEE